NEHILPENPMDDWEQHFPRQQREEAVYRLGTMTLLEPAANRQVGNANYAVKLSAYSRSVYVLTRKISEIASEQWTLNLLEERQRRLAERAVHLWRADFA
ncbi:MAG: HNH endonuclease, partial [Candidatus Tectomicrobia bacterium]|nr:HNH endonuclease [Candidatus Tectomicrobia bacterium]